MSRTFSLGQLLATTDVLKLCDATGLSLEPLLDRHGAADWGDVNTAAKAHNDTALATGGRLQSVYDLPHCRICIITGEDRCQTIVMQLEETGTV